MNSISLLLLLCGSIILTVGVAGMVYLIVTSRKPKQGTVTVTPQPAQKGFKSWIVPFVIACVVSFWSVSLAFVYLLILWVLRLNPKKKMSPLVTPDGKKICEKNYKWLRNSSFFTVPVFLIALVLDAHPAIAAFLPFLFHIRLIGRLQTENLYVYRHTQQSLYLLLLRAGTAIAIFSLASYFDGMNEGVWLFVIINGSLWLFGTNWEIAQVKQNDCWLMRRRDEEIILAMETPDLLIDTPALMDKETEKQITSIDTKTKNTRVKQSLQTFRTGTPDEKKKALRVLSELGEVEKF